jgi:phosphatidylserine decarboxylase
MARVEDLLRRAGLPVVDVEPLPGGPMGVVVRAGDAVVKVGAADGEQYAAEARGLARLGAAGVRVPEVLHLEADGLVMRWLEPGDPDWEGLAVQLAHLHTTRVGGHGSNAPVFLGRLRLPAVLGSSADVWVGGRLGPVLAGVRGAIGPLAARVDRVVDRVEPPLEGPVLLHGDLWSGNVHMSSEGAALLDPSGWCGERAVDLAMMTLFGGFPTAFWRAYEGLAPVPDEVRAHLPYWRLYFVLAHVQFFGRTYLPALQRELDALTHRIG